jgi:hypothetical protein
MERYEGLQNEKSPLGMSHVCFCRKLKVYIKRHGSTAKLYIKRHGSTAELYIKRHGSTAKLVYLLSD